MNQSLTGPQLEAFAHKVISDEMLAHAMKEKPMKDFIRIFTAMGISCAFSKKPANFAHAFVLRDTNGLPTPVEILIQIRPGK